MEQVTRQLADFAFETKYEDLPETVTHESKRVLLDSLGCALAGLTVDKGRFGIRFARRMGGAPEATIIGVGDRTSCASAAFANGELINALDYDAIMPPAGHVAPCVIPAPLAVAEYMGSSGRDLILAISLSHEVSCRIASGLSHNRDFVREGPRRGEMVRADVYGYGHTVFGGTAGVAKILGFDREKMLNAMGIAGCLVPVGAHMKWFETLPVGTLKYLSPGAVAQTELTAAFLADEGHLGDHSILDGDHGFWRFYGSTKWEPAAVLQDLGRRWALPSTMYKASACCAFMLPPLECFTNIIEQNGLTPQQIENVKLWLDPLCEYPIWRNNELTTHVDAQFCIAYVLSAAAYGVKTGADLQNLATLQDPKIRQFMSKVSLETYPEFGKRVLDEPRKRFLSKVEITAEGKTYVEERCFFKGDPSSEETKLTDTELMDKFRDNASHLLSREQIGEIVHTVLNLDELRDVSELMRRVAI